MIIITPSRKFKEDIKFYIRKKKYFLINKDISVVESELAKGHLVGNKLDNLNLPCGDVYKVRLPNSSTNEGKSNGFRLLYYAVLDEKIYLLTIYSKKDDIRVLNDKQIALLAKNILTD